MKRWLVAFAAGAIFGTGLVMAKVTDPSVVLAFLDVGGDFDPQLLFMFAGGVLSYGALHRLVQRRRPTPVLAAAYDMPVRGAIDARLLAGATVFGVGWGLAGICPGPAFTTLATGAAEPIAFTLAMLGGMLLFEKLLRPLLDSPLAWGTRPDATRR